MKRILIILSFILFTGISGLSAKEYNASFFGIKSNGTTNNTTSIQKAVDYINSQGGGTLVFYVGRYLTGTVYLKSNVNIDLKEGAVIVGSFSPYDYDIEEKGPKAIFVAKGQTNIRIFGDGVIEGGGMNLVNEIHSLMVKKFLTDAVEIGMFRFDNCINITIEGLNLWYGTGNTLNFSNCRIVNLDNLNIDGKKIPGSVALALENNKWTQIKDLFINGVSVPIVLIGEQHPEISNSIMSDGKDLNSYL